MPTMAENPSLLGPPELHNNPTLLLKQLKIESFDSSETFNDPFIDLMVSNLNKTEFSHTDNNLNSSENPCLDFFLHVGPETPLISIIQRLQQSWNHDPLTTLKLICNLRDVQGAGKSDEEGFYAAVLWLHRFHPKTLALSVPSVANFGSFKDLPEILYRLLEGYEARQIKSCAKEGYLISRDEKRLGLAKRVYERYNKDDDFRFLHEKVSDFFSDCLKADMEYLKSGRSTKISLAAKWCPPIDSSIDRSTLLCESVARKVFPRESYPEYDGMEDSHYAYRIRDRLRKEVLVPLRNVLHELEKMKLGADQPLTLLPHKIIEPYYNRYYYGFYSDSDHDDDHHDGDDDDDGYYIVECAEVEWKRMVDDHLLRRDGKMMKNSIAIFDVSNTMTGTLLSVSVAYGLLISELSEQPWKGKLVTFSRNPRLHVIEGETLSEKILSINRIESTNCESYKIDFMKVFDLILEVAVKGGLKEEKMIKRVFVFTDVEFDKASLRPWKTDYEAIVKKFTEKGYGNAIPEIVFWNLSGSGGTTSTPVIAREKGVVMVTGFSRNLMKVFLNRNGGIGPESVMEDAISGDEYQKLSVID